MDGDRAGRVRDDLRRAHEQSLQHVATPGAQFDASRRRAIAAAAIEAFVDPDPPPPWAQVHGDVLLDSARRLARAANTIDRSVFDRALADGMTATEWVEMVGVVISAVAPTSFARAAGLPLPAVPEPRAGEPSGLLAAHLQPARLNWVPVAAPADAVASVVQALSAVPAEWDNLWQLAAAQYMSDAQMADPLWTRGTLSRPQMELVAGRLSLIRECFF